MEAQHSVMMPHGSDAEAITVLSWIMFGGGAVIFLAVLVLSAMAYFGGETLRQRLAGNTFIFYGGVIFPLVTVTALLVYGLMLIGGRQDAATDTALRIQVSGEQWWWRVRYPASGDAAAAETANEIHIPVGTQVEIALSSPDVIHSLWVPSLAGKVDMIPGVTNRLRLRAQRPGIYRGQCAEYCGGPHAWMALHVVAVAPSEFDAWLARQRRPAAPPSTDLQARGAALFIATGCDACHAIRGTDAIGSIGPDLTHVGGRLSLAAATLPNDASSFIRWIRDNQHIKPANAMPPFGILAPEELAALAAYLESLQ